MKHLVSLLLCCFWVAVYAEIEPYQQGLIRTVTPSTPVDITSPASCFSEAILTPSYTSLLYVDISRKSLITFGVNQHYGAVFSNMAVEVTLNVQRDPSYSASGYSSSNDTTIVMNVSYSPNDSLSYNDMQTVLMNGWEKVAVQIVAIKVNGTSVNVLPANLYVQTDLFFERFYKFSDAASSTIPPTMNAYTLLDLDCDGTNDQIQLTWPQIDGAEGYQLEWTFVNDYDNSFSTSYVSLHDLALSFKENSTRISTSNREYLITLAFDHGYLFYRVRGVGRDLTDPTKYIFTIWSDDDSYTHGDDATNYYHNTVPYESTKNWQYSATYAEEAKKKEVVSFFDGSLRNRQMVTRINSDNNTIVGETIYDHQGRPAVQILPTPVNDPTCSATGAGASLKYYDNFNRSSSSDPFTKDQFDLSDSLQPCGLQSAPLDGSSGAGQYYSNGNPNLADENGYLPEAHGYAYSQVEYTPDNTGRIRRQGGVGADFQLGSGHETKYYYSHPFQEQLNMLFGSEVGDASHYQKNMVIDPNGQVSISYLDQEGRVIATSLAGQAPENIQPLASSAIDPLDMNVDLFAKDANGVSTANEQDFLAHSIVFSQTFSLSSPSNVTLNYGLEFPIYTDSCVPGACFHCVYDLSISVKDECGTELLPSDWVTNLVGNFSLGREGEVTFNINCGRDGDPDFNETVTIPSLPTGTYQIVKTLTVSEDAFNYNLQQYLDTNQNHCIVTLSEYQHQFLDSVNYTGCDTTISCQQCVDALGSLEDWLANGLGTQLDYQGAVTACMEPCTQPSYCETQKHFLMTDLSPGGQYGQFDEGATDFSAAAYPVSIYNSSNVMVVAPDVYDAVNLYHPNWREPRLLYNNAYVKEFREDDGVTRSTIPLTVVFSGSSIVSTAPELHTTAVLGTNVFMDANGEYYTYPENLEHLIDFVQAWKNSWAESFLVYHPEFSYYRTCYSFTRPSVIGETMTSEAFDQLMISCDTWASAVTHGFIDPSYATISTTDSRLKDFSNTAATVYDPFVAHASLFGSYGTNFAASIYNYQTIDGVTYSMMDIAAVLTRCSANLLGTIPSATCTRWGDPSPIVGMSDAQIRDAEWAAFKTIYLGAKQKAQLKLSHYRAVNDLNYREYNACIGTTSYNLFDYQFFDPFAAFPPGSQIMQPYCQPCSFATHNYYQNKIKRFLDPSDNPNATDPQYIAYQQYLQTGQCPIASNFEHLLSEIADRDYLEDASFSLNTMNWLSGLYLALTNYNPTSATPSLSWAQTTMTSTTLNASIWDGATLYATVHLNGTFPAGYSWADIDYFSGLQYTTTNTSGDDEFTLVAHINMVDSIYPVNFTGSTSFHIGGCTFQETCTPNQLGNELSSLLQAVTAVGLLDGPTTDVEDSSNPLSPLVTPFIQLAANGALTSSLYWEYDASAEEFYLYESTSADGMHLQILNTQPSFALSGIGSITSLGPLEVMDNNLFKVACYDASGNLLTTMTLQASYYHGGTFIQTISLGNCDLPTPLQCEGQPFDNVHLLEDFLTQALVEDGIQTTVPGYAMESSLTSQFSPDFTEADIHSGDNDTIIISFGDCEMVLNLDSAAVAAGLNINDITSIVSLVPSGMENNYGIYDTFTVQATFDTGGPVVYANMTGISCLPLQTCEYCAGESQDTTSGSMTQTRIANKSVDAYDTYKQEISDLNDRMGWTGTADEVRPIDYSTFYDFEVHYNMDEYLRFLGNYEPCVDEETFLLHPDQFINYYGQGRNLKLEYQRYVRTVDVYNQYADVYSYTHLIEPTIEQFSASTYADNVQALVEIALPHIVWHLRDSVIIHDSVISVGHHPDPIVDPMISSPSSSYLDSSDCFAMYTAYRDTMLAKYAGCDWISPVTYDEFIAHNLCCQPNGVDLYNRFMSDLESVRTGDCKTVYSLPYSKDTCMIAADPESDCYDLYKGYLSVVSSYNSWEYADTNHLLVVLYDSYDWFKQTGKCDCVEGYIRYIDSIMTYDSVLTTVMTLDEYCPTTYSNPDTLCQSAYQDYLDCVANYNDYVAVHGGTRISELIRLDVFLDNQLCNCVSEYCALLSLLEQPGHEKDPLPDLLKLCAGVEAPCTPNQPVASTGTLPNFPPADPCLEMLNSVALANAQAAYDQQIQDLTTYFTQAYYAKCMGAVEEFTMQYQEKEYHRTLYYYDQAGNLIKTIPPEGVEILDVVSAGGALNDQINSDRLNGTHTVLTSHRMATRYVYNSLNQLVAQHMPDQDDMDLFEISQTDGLVKGLTTTSIQMVSSNKGYLTGYVTSSAAAQGTRGYLYETANGGKTWTRVHGTVVNNLQSVYMADNSCGFAVAANGLLLYTANGGLSWDLIDTYGSGIMEDFTAVSGDGSGNVVASTKTGKLLRMNSSSYTSIAQISQLTLPGGSDPIAEIVSLEYGSGNYFASAMLGTTSLYGALLNFSSTITTSTTAATFEKIYGSDYSAIDYYSTTDGVAGSADGKLIALNDASSFKQTQGSSSNISKVIDLYMLNQQRGIALLDEGANTRVVWTQNGGQNWLNPEALAMENYVLGIVERSSSAVTVIAQANGKTKRLTLQLTGNIAVINQSADPLESLPAQPTLVASVIDGSNTYYYTVSNDQLFVSNMLTSSSTHVSYTNIATLTGLSTATRLRAVKVSGGYMVVASKGADLLAWKSTTPSGTYTAVTFSGASGSLADFGIVDNAGTPQAVAYDNTNRKLFRKDLTMTASGSMTAITSSGSNWPVAASIRRIAVLSNGIVTLAGNDGRLFTTTSDARTASSTTITNRSDLRSLKMNDLSSSTTSGINYVAVGDNGTLFNNTAAIATDMSAGWYQLNLAHTEDLHATAPTASGHLIGGDNAVFGTVDLSTAAISDYATVYGTTVGQELATDGIRSIVTYGNVVFAAGENGKLFFTDDLTASYFTKTIFGAATAAAMSPTPVGRVILVSEKGNIYRLTGPFATETREIFNPQYKEVHFDASGKGTLVGDHYLVRTSNDNGLNWSVDLPSSTSELTAYRNSLLSVWTKPAVNGNHFAIIGGNSYFATVSNGAVTSTSYTGDATEIEFRGSGPVGYITAGSTLNQLTLSSVTGGYTASVSSYSTGTAAIKAIHVFENQSVMMVGNNFVDYQPVSGLPVSFTETSYSGNFRDVYFHDDMVGYIVGEAGIFYRVTSDNIDASTHEITGGLDYDPKGLVDAVVDVSNENNLDVYAIAFGSRYDGVWGGKYLPAFSPVQQKPYVRTIKDQSGEFSSQFFYDRLGRIVVSRNSRQSADGKFSYTLYDALGRVYEAGEKSENTGTDPQFASIFGTYVNGSFVSSVIDDNHLDTWLTTTSGDRKEVTRSYYDATNTAIAAGLPTTFTPDVLTQRKRIVHVTYEAVYDADDATYDHATHYDYDIHGNVKTLLQDNRKMAGFDPALAAQQFKRVDYVYDLISGNVHRVDYQTDQIDQWHHSYHYDADNRITDVYTTTSTPLASATYGTTDVENEYSYNPLWVKEVQYTYYAHGPLARTELGNNQVQGLDYVYTLQGWVKAVNSNTLDESRDPGLDGDGMSAHHNVARDVYGFSLHYFDGDYTAIGGSNSFLADQSGSDLANSSYSSDLYNGNIGRMVTTITDPNTRDILPLGNAYQYDQLNRLIGAKSFNNLSLSGNAWQNTGAAIMYQNDFTYDANGNIAHQERYDESGNPIDKMDYYYPLNGLGKKVRNQLQYVDDGTDYDSEDIDPGMSSTNYQYDQEGRLIADAQEGIDAIIWRVDGKVSEIQRPASSGKKNLRFDYDAMGHRIAKHVYDDSWALEKSSYYLLDAQGNTLSVYEYVVDAGSSTVTYAQEEKYIYGSSRVGVLKESVYLLGSVTLTEDMSNQIHITGQRSYELTNHLGNVLSVISDKVIPEVETTQDYSNDFSSSFSGFVSNGTSTLSISGGRLKVSGSSYANRVRRNFSTIAGRTYEATVDLDLASSGTLAFLARNTTTGSNIQVVTANSNGTYTIQFVAQTSVTELAVQNNYSTGTRDYYLDNLTLLDVTVTGYLADILQSTDYSPFGVTLHERNMTLTGAEKFRFGFQNQEMDDEIKGEGNSVNFEFRIYDVRLGRFLSTDPLEKQYPSNSPYSFSENRVIDCTELEGLECYWSADGSKMIGQIGNSKEVRICNTKADEIHVRNAVYKQNKGLVTSNPAKFSESERIQQEYKYDCKMALANSKKAEVKMNTLTNKAYATALKEVNSEHPSASMNDEKNTATKILETKNVTYAKVHSSGVVDKANANDNINDAAKGSKMRTSDYGHAQGALVPLNENMAVAFLSLAQQYKMTVSEIAGGKHGPTSLHYQGKAFDITHVNGTYMSASSEISREFCEKARSLGFNVGEEYDKHHIHIQWGSNKSPKI